MSRNDNVIDSAKLVKEYYKENSLEQMPQNKHGLCNGTVLVAEGDYPFFRLNKGDYILICWNGKFVSNGAQTWSVDGICSEIDNGYWSIKEIE